MKIKKKEVSRLHEIIYGPSFYDGNEEVSEIKLILNKICERSQNKSETKTVQEEPVGLEKFFRRMASFDHRMGLFNNIIKQGEPMVAASTDETIIFKGGLRDAVEAIKENEDRHKQDLDAIRREADEALLNIKKSVYDTDPKIGDVGFFNLGIPNAPIVYGRIRNFTGNNYQDTHGNWYVGFSKTPPELK